MPRSHKRLSPHHLAVIVVFTVQHNLSVTAFQKDLLSTYPVPLAL